MASRALAGIDAPEVTVEVHLGPGLPAFHIVGLPDTEVREARDRVRAALNHAHFEFPARRMTVNLAPAELPKDSSRFDLPIALGILAASGQLSADAFAGQEFAGELSLTGELRAVRGALAMALSARGVGRAFVLPADNAPQAALADGVRILPARTLLEVVAHLSGDAPLATYVNGARHPAPKYADFSEVAESPDVSISMPMAHAILTHEQGADLQYYLGKNRAEAERIASYTVPMLHEGKVIQAPDAARQLLELGILAAQLRAQAATPDAPAAAPAKPITKAPAPIKPQAPGTTETAKPIEEMSMEEYAEYRKPKLAAERRPGARRNS